MLIWSGVEYVHFSEDRYVIHVGPERRQRIEINYQRQFGQPPTHQELQSLVNRYIRDEIYLREALALKLDNDDEIIRRRLRQKYEFLYSDLAMPDVPDAATIEQWFKNNREKYVTPRRVDFLQVYFSPDFQGDEATKRRASSTLAELLRGHVTRASELGDPFPGRKNVHNVSLQEANAAFGQSELTERLFRLPIGKWSGPFRSGFGWHLVYVNNHISPKVAPLAQLQEQVRTDYMEQQRAVIEARNFQKLLAKYVISSKDPAE